MISVFNRGFSTLQLQLPTGNSITFNTWELSRQVIWELQPLETGNIFDAVLNKFTWTSNYMWSVNTPINLTTLTNLEAYLINNEISVVQAVEYAGTQVLQHLPEQAPNKILDFLNRLDKLRFTTKRGLRLNNLSTTPPRRSTRGQMLSTTGRMTVPWNRSELNTSRVSTVLPDVNMVRLVRAKRRIII